MEAANMSNYNKIELEILLTKGDSIPKEVAKKLTENKAKCPDNTHHLRHQLNNWYGMPNDNGKCSENGKFQGKFTTGSSRFFYFQLTLHGGGKHVKLQQKKLEILLTKGDSIPKEVAKKLTENKAKCPDNTHHLRHQLNKWYGMLQICFGKEALITKEARAWIDHVDKFELSYDARFKTDTEFGVKVLGLIDLTFFQFCDSCLKADSLEEVDFGSIALDNDRYNITKHIPSMCTSLPCYPTKKEDRRRP
jgi:hypothetical protein